MRGARSRDASRFDFGAAQDAFFHAEGRRKRSPQALRYLARHAALEELLEIGVVAADLQRHLGQAKPQRRDALADELADPVRGRKNRP